MQGNNFLFCRFIVHITGMSISLGFQVLIKHEQTFAVEHKGYYPFFSESFSWRFQVKNSVLHFLINVTLNDSAEHVCKMYILLYLYYVSVNITPRTVFRIGKYLHFICTNRDYKNWHHTCDCLIDSFLLINHI